MDGCGAPVASSGRMNPCKRLLQRLYFLFPPLSSVGIFPAHVVGMIELRLCLRTPSQRTRSLLTALRALARLARLARGCVEAQLFSESQDRRNLCYTETWDSEEDLCAMLRSEHFTCLAALMEAASEPPALSFRRITAVDGLEFVRQARLGRCDLGSSEASAMFPVVATDSREH